MPAESSAAGIVQRIRIKSEAFGRCGVQTLLYASEETGVFLQQAQNDVPHKLLGVGAAVSGDL